MLIDELNSLTSHHMRQCKLYRDYVNSMFPDYEVTRLADLPYLPVRAFKDFHLKSVPNSEIYKTMLSSGTSGNFSKIYIDKVTAKNQTLSLVESFADHFGPGRFPMLVIDTESTVRERHKFSARTAAINGFSMFSRGRCFALDENMLPNFDRINAFLDLHKGKRVFVFGFTFLIWNSLIRELQKKGETLSLENSFLLHGGGWKKLEAEKVSDKVFADCVGNATGISSVHNYYGMVEQTGTIFIQCEHGCMHASRNSSALVRDPYTHDALEHGRLGLIQVFSSIQVSYPGHSLLTEDLGRTYAGEDCPCGRLGTIVEVDGRLSNAEIRGCSDAYP